VEKYSEEMMKNFISRNILKSRVIKMTGGGGGGT
jgi:hypothetical protein